jgi:hypothetical protein
MSLNLVSLILLLLFLPNSLGDNNTLIDDFYFFDEIGENFAGMPFIDLSGPCKLENKTTKKFECSVK